MQQTNGSSNLKGGHMRAGSMATVSLQKSNLHNPITKAGGIKNKIDYRSQSKDQALTRIMNGNDSMVSMLMKETVMLRNNQGTHITERMIRQNNQNMEVHFPDKIDKYNPDQVLKKKDEAMQ